MKVNPPLVGTDLKTCGHAAHIACFNAYRASLVGSFQEKKLENEKKKVRSSSSFKMYGCVKLITLNKSRISTNSVTVTMVIVI